MAKGSVLLAAGGTGGHLFPAEALAHALRERGWVIHLVTDGRAGRFAGLFPAEAIHAVPSATIGSRNPVAFIRSLLTIWHGVRTSAKLIGELRPRVVIGFGGYPSVPPLFAATRRGVPTLIHEQNAVMGRANRALAGRVTAIAGGFLSMEASADDAKTVVTGNPVRPAVIKASAVPYSPAGPEEAFRLLVFGGSQGARYFSDAIPSALAALPENLRKRIVVMQQVRAEDEARVRGFYSKIEVKAEISSFFADIPDRMAAAHLIISRAGASTVSEIAIIGRPALLVPYPHALDHDQAANAAALAAAGGAEVHQQPMLTPDKIAERIGSLMQAPARLAEMAAAAKSAARPDAAELLADLAEAIADRRSVGEFRKGGRQ